jgi:hypothetical protein
MSNTLTLGGIGAIAGAILGPIFKILTPDGTECLHLFASLPSSGPWLDAFIKCSINEVLVGAVICGAIGAALGAFLGD